MVYLINRKRSFFIIKNSQSEVWMEHELRWIITELCCPIWQLLATYGYLTSNIIKLKIQLLSCTSWISSVLKQVASVLDGQIKNIYITAESSSDCADIHLYRKIHVLYIFQNLGSGVLLVVTVTISNILLSIYLITYNHFMK